MNIFMILLMTIMFATYQYFTAKKSSNVTLNKEEMEFQIELSCLKQFHDYAAAKNETTLNIDPSGNSTIGVEGVDLKASYECTGAGNVHAKKYCLNGGNQLEACATAGESGEHCVATARAKIVDNSLKSVMFRAKIYDMKDGKINGKPVPTGMQAPNSFGLVSCVPAKKIEQQRLLANENCAVDEFAIVKDDGGYECIKVPNITPCTAHEDMVTSSGGRSNCTALPAGGSCCAKSNTEAICGAGNTNIRAVWNPRTRFFNCTNAADACAKSLSMPVKNEKGNLSSVNVNSPYVPKYNASTKAFDCTPNAAKLVEACKGAARTNEHAFVSVDGLDAAGGSIVCTLASKASAAAIENCSACGTAELVRDSSGRERWECRYSSTWSELWSRMSADGGYYNTLKGNKAGASHATNVKGVKGCFSGCEEFESKIKSGVRNTPAWGLVWRPQSHLWECFKCDTREYINSACETEEQEVCNSSINGLCTLKACDETYQKRMTASGEDALEGDPAAKCYTKWCRNIPADVDAKIGRPNDASCTNVPTHPQMIYNPEKECVYCARLGPEILE
ncbi:MAG: hypothetical protein LBO78_04045 [Rickettsiales bacterium]|nr:hypothetical protein [Rickettsiales bacterium]